MCGSYTDKDWNPHSRGPLHCKLTRVSHVLTRVIQIHSKFLCMFDALQLDI